MTLAGCSDGTLIGDAVWHADLTGLDRQRTCAFVEFLQDCRLMVCNSWTHDADTTRREWSSGTSGFLAGSETQCDFVLVSTDIPLCEVGVIKDTAFSSDHWPVSVSCAPSKRWNLRQKSRICTSRVPRRWCPPDQFVACVDDLADTPGHLATKIASWCSVACEQALLPAVHGVSDELQELLNRHHVVERRLISKLIWGMRRKERRKRAVETIPVLLNLSVLQVPFSLAAPITSIGPRSSVPSLSLLTGRFQTSLPKSSSSKGRSWRLKTPLALHVSNIGLMLVEKRVTKLLISRELLDKAIRKLERGRGSADGCVAQVYHALSPSARELLMTGLQELSDGED